MKRVFTIAISTIFLAAPIASASMDVAYAKAAKHHKKTPSTTENKQTKSGGQPGGGAGRS